MYLYLHIKCLILTSVQNFLLYIRTSIFWLHQISILKDKLLEWSLVWFVVSSF